MANQTKNQANVLAKECIVEALIQLLDEKPLSAITISELTEKAGVSRMTYYRNYHSKEDIFETYLDDVIGIYYEEVSSLMLQGNLYDMQNLTHCFQFLKEHRYFLDSLFKSGFGYLLLKTICKYVMKTWYRTGDDKEHFYKLQAFSGSLYNMYLAWSVDGMKETPEKMAQILYDIYSR